MKAIIKSRLLNTMLFLIVSIFSNAQLLLPKLISDGMVLQRDTQINLYGWDSPKQHISIHFKDKTYTTITDKRGKWSLQTKKHKAGGPYQMEIIGSSTIQLKNILIGDVWVCSGQSNMAYPMSNSEELYKDNIQESENNFIRQFLVPRTYAFHRELDDLKAGTWIPATPATVKNFSAVAYFFATKLYTKHHIPIGLLNTSVSGSPAQAWISEKSLKKFPHYLKDLSILKDPRFVKNIEYTNTNAEKIWIETATKLDLKNKNLYASKDSIIQTDWTRVNLPSYCSITDLDSVNGIVWFRKTIVLSDTQLNCQARLNLGRISDADSVFINSHFIGTTAHKYATRNYSIPKNILVSGKNTISVKVTSYRGQAGFIDSSPIELVLGAKSIDLQKNWKYKLSTSMPVLAPHVQLNWKPSGLYNAMIHPLLNYKLKGFIWYQGEGNVSKANEYKTLFPSLINDWRSSFQQGNLPFIFVQLANYQKPNTIPSPSNWALLRDAQLYTLELANTGMAIAIDIGEEKDIHPKNKKDIGYRLAWEANRLAYNSKNHPQSPLFIKMKTEKNNIILSFSAAKNLRNKNSLPLHNFQIAGADKKFVWASAMIKGTKIIVSNPSIKNPIAVRYAWANNPEYLNLIDINNLPISPFRTDNWKK